MKTLILRVGWPWIIGAGLFFAVPGALFQAGGWPGAVVWYGLAVLASGFMLFFFRNPPRKIVQDVDALVSGADGLIRAVETFDEPDYMGEPAVRISIFLSPLNVHVNRTPMAGTVSRLAYHRGRHLLTMDNRSSELNQHSTVLVENESTRCLLKQIVGPVVRRVVYWLDEGQRVEKGEVFGMMKFGSRLDMYFPEADVDVLIKKGDVVRAGTTVVARLKAEGGGGQ